MSRPYHTRYTRKCHCAMCGSDHAGGHTKHRSYRAVGIAVSEEGIAGMSKSEARRLRRTREARVWAMDMEVE